MSAAWGGFGRGKRHLNRIPLFIARRYAIMTDDWKA